MIRYSLKCVDGHQFESWFQSSGAFEKLAVGGMLACAICGSAGVSKAIMAPGVASSAEGERGKREPGLDEKIAALRKHVVGNSDYVGDAFAKEARDMHEGRSPSRAIYGETRPEEARKLIEDGVPVAPLPFLPPRKVN